MTFVRDRLADGLTVYAERSGDQQDATFGAQVAGTVEDALDRVLSPAEPCVFAFPGMVLADVRVPAIVVVTPSRIVSAWNKGLVRKRAVTLVIDRSTVTGVSVGRHAHAPEAVTVTTTGGSHSWALQPGKPHVAQAIAEGLSGVAT